MSFRNGDAIPKVIRGGLTDAYVTRWSQVQPKQTLSTTRNVTSRLPT